MKKYKYLYGGTDPATEPKPVPKVGGPMYLNVNPQSTLISQQNNTSLNLNSALRFKNLLTGANKNLVPSGDYNTLMGGTPNQQVGGGQRAYAEVDPMAITKADSVINASRGRLLAKFDVGGKYKKTPSAQASSNLPVDNNVATIPSTESSGSGFNNTLGSTAPFLDNFANLIATSKTPQIPNPVYTSAPRLNTKINVNPQLRQVQNDATAASMGIDKSTSSASVANANKGKILSEKWRAIGNIEANKQNTEAQLGNQAAYADYQSRASNNALTNQRNFNQMQRTDDVNNRYAGVLSDFGSDIANINREQNLRTRDKEAMQMLSKINPDTAYQFADTPSFKDLYKQNEPALKELILKQSGSVPRARLVALYKELYGKDFPN